jgi:FtsZ-interacting cell division protein ZipA
MVFLGLVLLVGAGVFTAAVITSNTTAVGADLWGWHIDNLSLGGVFVAGMVAGVAALLGLVMLFGGMRRSARLSRERRQLAKENARLAHRQAEVDRNESDRVSDQEVLPVNRKTVVEPAPVPTERTTERTVEHTGRTDYDSTDHDRVVDRDGDAVREHEVVRERVADDRLVDDRDRTADEEYVPAGGAHPTVSERVKARTSRWRR